MKSHWHKISHMWQYNGNFRESKKKDNVFFSSFNIHCQRFLSLKLIPNAVNRFLLSQNNYKNCGKMILSYWLRWAICKSQLTVGSLYWFAAMQKGPLNPSQSLWLAHANAHYSLNRKPHSLNIIMPANLYSFLPRVTLEIF